MTFPIKNTVLAVLLALAAGAHAADAQVAAGYGPFGLDLSAPDPAVKPGDDFFVHANGRYLARTQIPPEQDSVSRRSEISDRVALQLKAILEQAAEAPSSGASDGVRSKVGAFYASFMDEKRIGELGVAAIDPELNAIRAARGKDELAALMGRSNDGFFPSLFSLTIDVDVLHPERYAVYLSQSGLGLPSTEYYSRPDAAPVRAAYGKYIETLLGLLKWDDAAKAARAVQALEAQVAKASWTMAQRRDPTTQYNPLPAAQLPVLAPGVNWPAYLQAARLGDKATLVVTQKSAVTKLAALFRNTPEATLKAWMAFRVADEAAPYLPPPFETARFEFRGRVLAGQKAPEARWQRGVAAVAGARCSYAVHSCFGTLKWAVGQLYVQQHFTPDTKAQITALAAQVKAAFRQRLQANAWMSSDTKAEALRKLDATVVKVGYPAVWRAYEGAAIQRNDVVANVRAAAVDDWDFIVKRSAGAVDRDEWLLAPQENNAYNGAFNDLVFPAAALQAPVFDAAADPAVNFGAAGAFIGHEITHSFDDEGRTVDSEGRMRDWWTKADAASFVARAKRLGAQYARYEPVRGMRINPELTMGENIADLGGVSVALEAYRLSLAGQPAPVLGGLTGEQRLFLSWAQVWAGLATEQETRRLTAGDPHSDRKFRVNGVVRNLDDWYAAFGVKPGDALYLKPEQRVRIW